MITYFIKDRLMEFAKYKNISLNKLEESCGFSKRYFSNVKYCLPKKKIIDIARFYSELNIDWLITGEGPMLITADDKNFMKLGERVVGLTKYHEDVLQRIYTIFNISDVKVADFIKQYPNLADAFDPNAEVVDFDLVFDLISTVIKDFSSFSADWIIYGEGDQTRNKDRILPVLSIHEIAKGVNACNFNETKISFFQNADFFTRVDSEKFSFEFKPNDLLACRNVDAQRVMLFSSLPYILCLNDGTIIIRHAKWSKSGILISESKTFEENESMTLDRNKVTYMAEVVGFIRFL